MTNQLKFCLDFLIISFPTAVLWISLKGTHLRDAGWPDLPRYPDLHLSCLSIVIHWIHSIVILEDGLCLNYTIARIYSGRVEFFVFCLTTSLIISGGLRLLSLVRNSETGGLHILGPENIAVVKIRRWVSFTYQFLRTVRLEW